MRLLWSEVATHTLEQIANEIRKVAKPAKDVSIGDLMAPTPEASHGLYFFLEGNQFAYVGIARSRCIIERVPAHFDTREESWFGTLLGKLVQADPKATKRTDVLDRALQLRVAVLFVDDPTADVSEAERIFIHGLLPFLNPPKRPRGVEMTRPLAELA